MLILKKFTIKKNEDYYLLKKAFNFRLINQ